MDENLNPEALLNVALEQPDPDASVDSNPQIPGFELDSPIGRGGMGSVWRARQLSLNRPVAIKFMNPAFSANPEFKLRFRREAESMAALHHPHIVSVFDFGETPEGNLFLVMELVDGTDLGRLMAEGPLPCGDALRYTEQICAALEYAHREGYVHRDIKPANILVNKDGEAKVADFGLARITEADDLTLTVTGATVGTPHYMAPEQDEGESVDHRADLFSLGVLIYEMLTGTKPRGNWEPPSKKRAGVSPQLDPIVARAMASEPNSRFQSASEMREELSSVSASASTETVKRRPRNWLWLALGAIGITLVTLMIIVDPSNRNPSPAAAEPTFNKPVEIPDIEDVFYPKPSTNAAELEAARAEFEADVRANNGYVGKDFALCLEFARDLIPETEFGYRPDSWRSYTVPQKGYLVAVLWIREDTPWAASWLVSDEMNSTLSNLGYAMNDNLVNYRFATWIKDDRWKDSHATTTFDEGADPTLIPRRVQRRRLGPQRTMTIYVLGRTDQAPAWRIEEVAEDDLSEAISNRGPDEILVDVSFLPGPNSNFFHLLWHEREDANEESTVTIGSFSECLEQVREMDEAGWRPIALNGSSARTVAWITIGWRRELSESSE